MTSQVLNDSDSPLPQHHGWWRQQAIFTRKELRETLRDRRTIITLLAMPLLLYPLLGMVFRFMAVQQPADQKIIHRIALASDIEGAWLSNALQEGNRALKELPSAEGAQASPPMADPELKFFIPNDATQFDLLEIVATGGADVGVRVRLPTAADSNLFQQADVELVQAERSPGSRDATLFIQRRLQALNIATAAHWAREGDETFQIPILEHIRSVAPKGRTSALLGVLPLVLLLMTVTGGVYPAIDLTAGERERDTMETLMALPVSRGRLLLAKYVAVVTVTLLTGLMNLAVMAISVYALQLESTLFGEAGLSLGLAVRLLAVLMVFSLFYSAVLLLLTSTARSFKEAQAYLIPLMLLSITPGLLILMPGWRLTGALSAVPLVNMLLLARELLEGTVTVLPAIVAVVTTLAYAAAALLLATQVFGTDAVMVGSREGWGDLFRRPAPALRPTPAQALVVLACLFPAYFFVSGFLGRDVGQSIRLRLLNSGVLTVLLFCGVPLLALLWQRVALRSGLRMHGAHAMVWPAAIVLGLSTWPWVYELVLLLQALGLQVLSSDRMAQVEGLLTQWRSIPMAITVLALGVVPGICEELFFRGYLFAGLRERFRPWPAILISGVTFGLFHVVLAGGAAPERLVPSTGMGLLLGWVAWRTGSVLPAMLLHVTHNSTLLVMAHYRDALLRMNVGAAEQSHLPTSWLIASGLGIVVGIVAVRWSSRQNLELPEPSLEPA